jgi:2-keto-4-pentenoate hydratase/2-oxohepta-3-ene-1,7-dioic acid hydratase in catechol pathway
VIFGEREKVRVATYRAEGGERIGLVEGDTVLELGTGSAAGDLGALLDDLAALERSHQRATLPRPLAEVRLAAPVPRPSKVLCVGRNFAEHASEAGAPLPEEPIFFAKLPSAIIGPNDPIRLPAAAPRRVDYEAELAVVIGRRGRDIAEADAPSFVLGYTVANDVTARDWQLKKPGGQWTLGKSFDTFLPLGPWLVTADEVGDLGELHITCAIGGETLQDDTADHMIYSIPQLIAYVSRVVTLEPGDLLLTGTPAGTGSSRVPPRWLCDGDLLETAISGIGAMANPVRLESATR